MSSPIISPERRRHDLDWLRVLAFGLLVPFHCAVLFLPESIPNMPNEESSLLLAMFVAFSHQFRLAVLFLVSGMGVRFALNKRRGPDFFKERSARLLIPLLFGIVALVPAMVFLERVYNASFTGSAFQFYGQYFTQGLYPEGHLSWHHFWFLAYLYLFCLISWPIFNRWLKRAKAGRKTVFDQLESGTRIYWIIVPLIVIELVLRPVFPGFRNLVADWASFTHWLVIFALGFGLALNSRLVERVKQLRNRSLLIAMISSGAMLALFYDTESYGFAFEKEYTVTNIVRFIAFSILRVTAAWCWVLTCVGFAARYLNHGSMILTYLNQAVYPLFCLHLPVIVVAAFFILPQDTSIAVKFAALTVGSFVLVFLLYELVVKRVGRFGALVGYKPLKEASTKDVVLRSSLSRT